MPTDPTITTALDAVRATLGERRVLLATFHGSRLYGTATPTSDLDVRVVFLPTDEEILMGEHDFSYDNNPTKRTLGLGDVDVSAFSFSRFLRLLGKFDVNAVEMLFASTPGTPALITSDEQVMGTVRSHAPQLLAMGGASPISHARAIVGSMAPDQDAYTEAFQHGLDAILAAQHTAGSSTRLYQVPDLLAKLRALPGAAWMAHGTHERVILEEDIPSDVLAAGRWAGHSLFVLVADRKLATTMTLHEMEAVLSKPLRRMKDELKARRARAEGVAISPKDLYHAVRILDQFTELQTTGVLTFPRPNADTLLAIRNGQITGDALQGVINTAFSQALAAKEQPSPFVKVADTDLRRTLTIQAHRAAVLANTSTHPSSCA